MRICKWCIIIQIICILLFYVYMFTSLSFRIVHILSNVFANPADLLFVSVGLHLIASSLHSPKTCTPMFLQHSTLCFITKVFLERCTPVCCDHRHVRHCMMQTLLAICEWLETIIYADCCVCFVVAIGHVFLINLLSIFNCFGVKFGKVLSLIIPMSPANTGW